MVRRARCSERFAQHALCRGILAPRFTTLDPCRGIRTPRFALFGFAPYESRRGDSPPVALYLPRQSGTQQPKPQTTCPTRLNPRSGFPKGRNRHTSLESAVTIKTHASAWSVSNQCGVSQSNERRPMKTKRYDARCEVAIRHVCRVCRKPASRLRLDRMRRFAPLDRTRRFCH